MALNLWDDGLVPREAKSFGFYLACELLATGRMEAHRESRAQALLRGHMSTKKLAYLEIPTTDVRAMKDFYGNLFGWTFQDYGPDYAAFSESGLEGGFNADSSHKTKALLPVIETNDLAAMEAKVAAAGGVITMATFAYPGGRRFHFADPAGNELAVMQVD